MMRHDAACARKIITLQYDELFPAMADGRTHNTFVYMELAPSAILGRN